MQTGQTPHWLLLGCALLLALLLGRGETRAAAAIAPQQAPQPSAVAKYDNAPLYSGPSTAYPAVGTLAYGQPCTVLGRDLTTGWWLLTCPNGVSGWAAYDVVTVVGDLASIPLLSVSGVAMTPPAPAATPAAVNGWRASFFANQELAGAPVLVQDAPDINFNWGTGSPGPAVPAGAFSARFERTLSLIPGTYLLTVRMDDGARVFVDDRLVLDDWRPGAARDLAVAYPLGSNPRLRVEYVQAGGEASIFFGVTPLGAATPPPTPVPPWTEPSTELTIPRDFWRAHYFNNTELAGQPLAAQYEQRGFYPLEKYWGMAPPVGGLGTDYWSARFEGEFYFTPGDYDFTAQSDDGVRVYIDNMLIVNGWFDGRVQASNRFNQVGEGYHMLRVEYFERSGDAYLRVLWSLAGGVQPYNGPIPPPPT